MPTATGRIELTIVEIPGPHLGSLYERSLKELPKSVFKNRKKTSQVAPEHFFGRVSCVFVVVCLFRFFLTA